MLVSVLGLLGLTAATTTATAAPPQFGTCDDALLTQPFAAFGDLADYKLVAGGDFEAGATGWDFADGAALGAGGRSGDASAVLPEGASVTSPATCVNAAYPTLRFFARTLTGAPSGQLRVELLYRDQPAGSAAIPAGVVQPAGDWTPSRRMRTVSVAASALTGDASLSLRFTAVRGTWAIDDVFVDPYRRG
jgi:hypothetical protein